MKSIILAAGRGSRMGKLTDMLPKCMLTLKGEPLIHWQIRALADANINKIAVVCGYQKHAVQADGISEKIDNPRWYQTNMVRSLMYADAWLKSDICIVSYGDIFYESSGVATLLDCDADIAITYDLKFEVLWKTRQENPLNDLESFRVDGKGMLVTIGGQPQSIAEIQGQYMGLLKFTPDGWKQAVKYLNRLSEDKIDKLDMTSLLQGLIEKDVPVKTIPYDGTWGEVDTVGDLELYENTCHFLR